MPLKKKKTHQRSANPKLLGSAVPPILEIGLFPALLLGGGLHLGAPLLFGRSAKEGRKAGSRHTGTRVSLMNELRKVGA